MSHTQPPTPSPQFPALTVADLGEHALIARIHARVPPAPDFVHVGIGDDAAVVGPERNCLEVITTDCLIEGVHFDRTLASAADIGYKALAVNLSDLAAMAATPRVALLSLALPGTLPATDFEALLDGLLSLAKEVRLALVGGNIARSPGPLMIDLTAIGSVKPRRMLTRSGARPGDALYVSGTLGASAAGLGSLRVRRTGRLDSDQGELRAGPAVAHAVPCEARHLRPQPRLRLGALLGRTRTASACIDLSDGLADGIRQIAQASGVGAIVDAESIPIDAGTRAWFDSQGQAPVDAALRGGEDYELLFTVPRRNRRRLEAVQRLVGDLPITRVGHIMATRDVALRQNGQLAALPAGFVHFGGAAW